MLSRHRSAAASAYAWLRDAPVAFGYARLCSWAAILLLATAACGDSDGSSSGAGGSGGGASGSGGSGASGDTLLYVQLEDLSTELSDDAPGADLDAVCLNKGAAGTFCATQAISFHFGDSDNTFNNPTELLGQPDADCQVQSFTALGGESGDGHAIVLFGTPNDPVPIEPGDTIEVYELGPTVCPDQATWFDDPIRVSVSADSERTSFTVIGTTESGMAVTVP